MEIRVYSTENVSTESVLSAFAYASARSLRGGDTTSTRCGGEERNHEKNRKNTLKAYVSEETFRIDMALGRHL